MGSRTAVTEETLFLLSKTIKKWQTRFPFSLLHFPLKSISLRKDEAYT